MSATDDWWEREWRKSARAIHNAVTNQCILYLELRGHDAAAADLMEVLSHAAESE